MCIDAAMQLVISRRFCLVECIIVNRYIVIWQLTGVLPTVCIFEQLISVCNQFHLLTGICAEENRTVTFLANRLEGGLYFVEFPIDRTFLRRIHFYFWITINLNGLIISVNVSVAYHSLKIAKWLDRAHLILAVADCYWLAFFQLLLDRMFNP